MSNFKLGGILWWLILFNETILLKYFMSFDLHIEHYIFEWHPDGYLNS